MSRSRYYQHLLNSKRWKELRAWKFKMNPDCELCRQQGFIVPAVDIHHKTPVETGRTHGEMEQLCFQPDNLQSLCIDCHIKVHQQARSHSKEAHAQRANDALERWKASNQMDDSLPSALKTK